MQRLRDNHESVMGEVNRMLIEAKEKRIAIKNQSPTIAPGDLAEIKKTGERD